MTKKLYVLLAIIIGLGVPPAAATTFSATAEGNTITIFSHSDTEEICELRVVFSFFYQGERHTTATKCPDRPIVISDKAEVCSVTDVQINEPKIEGPVESKCR
jgi:hypothetical protein